MIGAPTGFEAFWQNIVLLYAAPVLQMLLWLVQIVVFVYAVMLLKRWVDYATGAVKPVAEETAVVAPEPVDVDKFVE